MNRKIDDFQEHAVSIEHVKGGVKCPTYLISAVRTKSPAQLNYIIQRMETYSPESAVAVAKAADEAKIEWRNVESTED